MSINRLSEAEVERLLTRQVPENPELALLGSALAAVHIVDLVAPSEEQVSRFASEAAAIARSAFGTGPSSKPIRRRRALTTLNERLAMVAVTVFVLAGMSGIAAAADAAAPNDLLYGIDRALERVGINDGAAAERLAEAEALAGRGQVTQAMVHAASAIEESPDDDTSAASTSHAATALREATVSVESGIEEPSSEEVRIAVSAMLAEIATLLGDPDLDGAEFGRRVSEMARSIAGSSASNDELRPGPTDLPNDGEEGRPDNADPPEGNTGGPPDGVPGEPADRAGGSPGGGPPSDTPGQSGPPPGSGRP